MPLVDGADPSAHIHEAILARLERNLRAVVEAAQAQGVSGTIIPTPTPSPTSPSPRARTRRERLQRRRGGHQASPTSRSGGPPGSLAGD